jgi:hypothetical protein
MRAALIYSQLTQQQQAEVVKGLHPLDWALWLTANSKDPQHSSQNLNRFFYLNRGLHKEYAAYMWLYYLKLASNFPTNPDHDHCILLTQRT